MNLTAWRAWRRRHYPDGTPRPHDDEDELGGLMVHMLSTRRGAIAIKRAERRYADLNRPQHTEPRDDRIVSRLRTLYRSRNR